MKQFDIKMPVQVNGRIMSEIIRLFNKYDSKIIVTKDDIQRQVDGKSLCGLYSLFISSFNILHVTVIGIYETNDSKDLQDQLNYLIMKY